MPGPRDSQKSGETPGAKVAPLPRRRKRFRRVRAVFRWTVRIAVVLTLILVGVLWYGAQRATDLTLWALRKAALDERVHLDKVTIHADRIEVENVRLKVGAQPEAVLEMQRLELEFDPLAIAGRELQRLTIHGPSLHVSGRVEDLTQRSPSPNPSANASAGSSTTKAAPTPTLLDRLAEGWQLHEVVMDPLPVTIELEGYPRMEAKVAVRTGLLQLGPPSLESGALRELEIESLRISRGGDSRNPPFASWQRLRMLFSLRQIRQAHI